ncbi:hypothetical protein [Chryseobacterium sp. SIMBA_038]|uniref:hypothetical protein n=2 Tax=Pseudomonadati TaxID=3379134 RepID=UPI00397B82C7
MKKKILLLSAIAFSGLSIAQVGVNTPDPKSTFDITAKNPTGITRTAEGLLVPRVDRQRAQSMTGVETSTLIYVNNVATGTQTGTAAQIDATGYYYFNGTIWTKMINDPALFADTSIYENNGTLSANRTVNQTDKTLAFTNTATTGTSHFTIDGATLNVDAVSNRVGLGTNAPQNRLHLGEDAPASVTDAAGKKLAVYNSAAGTSFYGLGISSNTLQMHAGSSQDAAPAMALTRSGYLGLGTAVPTTKLEIVSDNEGGTVGNDVNIRGYGTSKNPGIFLSSANGTAAAPTNLANNDIIGTIQFNARTNNTTTTGSSISSIYKGNGTTNLTDLTFNTSNSERLKIDETGKIGIGISSPTNLLHVNSSTSGAVKITDGTQGSDKVLTSDANGVGTWKALPAATVDINIYKDNGTLTGNRVVSQNTNTLAFTANAVNAFSVDGSTLSVDALNNRVGIGTNAPLSVLSVLNPTPGNTIDAFSSGINNCGAPCGQGTARNMTLFNANGTNSQFAGIDFIPAINANGISGASIKGIDRNVANGYAGLEFYTRNASGYAPRMTIKSSGNIGIGTQAPTNLFHVESTTNGAVKIVDGTQGANKVLTSDANGVATWRSPSATTDTSIYAGNGTLTSNRIVSQGSNILAFLGTSINAFSIDTATFSVDAANNRVGIGTVTPTNTLDIRSTTSGAVKIQDGTQKAGYILTSDSNGVGTWKPTAIAFGALSIPAITYSHPASYPTAKYTGVPITLPPGKWLLNVTLGIEFINSATDSYVKGSNFIRFRLGNTTADMGNSTFSPDAIQPRLASAGFAKSEQRGMVVGNLAMNNNSGSNKVYYLFVDNVSSTGGAVNFDVRFDWNESSITYQQIQ